MAADTSPASIAVTRKRLLKSSFERWVLQEPARGPAGGFQLRTIPHVTLQSIARAVATPPGEPLVDQPHRERGTRGVGPFEITWLNSVSRDLLWGCPVHGPAGAVRALSDAEVVTARLGVGDARFDDAGSVAVVAEPSACGRFQETDPPPSLHFAPRPVFRLEGPDADGRFSLHPEGVVVDGRAGTAVAWLLDEDPDDDVFRVCQTWFCGDGPPTFKPFAGGRHDRVAVRVVDEGGRCGTRSERLPGAISPAGA